MRSFLSAVSYSRFLVTASIVISIASSVAAIRQRRYDFESHVALLRGSISSVESSCEVSADVGCPSLGFGLTDSLGFRR